MPITTQPVSISSPDVPYSLLAIQISTVPQVSGGAINNPITIIGQRYRMLDSGPDFAPLQQWVRTSAAAGSDLSIAIIAAIQAYVAAKSIVTPDTNFPLAGLQLFISPEVISGQITGQAALVVKWYSSANNTIAFASPDDWHRESYPDIFAAAASDAGLAAVVTTILGAVQVFITAGGF